MPWNAEMRKTNGENLPQEVFFHREGGHDNRHVQRLDVREIGTQQKRPPGSVASSISRSSSFTRPDGGKGRCWVVPLVSEDWLFHFRLRRNIVMAVGQIGRASCRERGWLAV